MKHTPGPWVFSPPIGAEHAEVRDKNGRRICVTIGSYPMRTKTEDANAHLIAAAPDMLEALELVMETYCLYIDFTRETEQMRKARTLVGYAIDKATKG